MKQNYQLTKTNRIMVFNHFGRKGQWLLYMALLICGTLLITETELKAQCPNNNGSMNGNPLVTSLSSNGNVSTLASISTAACVKAGFYSRWQLYQGSVYRFATCGASYDTQLTVYRDDNGAFVSYNDDACGLQSITSFTAPVSAPYRVLVDQFNCVSNNTCTAVDGSVFGHINDACAEAIGIGLGSVSGDTRGGAADSGGNTTACGTSPGTGGGVWYRITGNGDQYRAEITVDNYDSKIRVFSGSCGALTCVTGDDDDGAGNNALADFCTTNGVQYYILVHGFGSSEGSFTLTMSSLGSGTPTITCPANITVTTDPATACSAVVNYPTPTATSVCGTPTVTLLGGPASGSTFPEGTTTIGWRASLGGVNDDCTFTVTVNDNDNPTAVCQDVTVSLDAGGNASITGADVNGGSTDNCAVAGLSVSPNTFGCANVDANSVTLTVTDTNGNAANCTATVTVEDNTPPTLVCQDVTLNLNASGTASANPFLNGAFVSQSDNCSVVGGLGVTGPPTYSCANIGTFSISATQDDPSGNETTCTYNVTVQDVTPPTAVCQNITVQLDATGNASVVGADVDGGSTDNCSIAGLSVSPNAFSCVNVGANSVTLTATDTNGNAANCTATVTVEDNVMPTAVCQDITVSLDAGGNASITGADVDGGSTDNCAVAGLSVSPTTFACADVGANSVTLTVTDTDSNVVTCTATVTVEDNTPPTLVCQDVTLNLNASGTASANPFLNGAFVSQSDNCSVVGDLGVTGPPTYSCANIGTFPISATQDDPSGNETTCTYNVTVQDVTPPTAVCSGGATLNIDASGVATVDAAALDGGSTDNCAGTLTFSASPATFGCADIGLQSVTLTVTDGSGNNATCNTTVEVADLTAPTFTDCPTSVVVSTDAGLCTATATWTVPTPNDNCSDPADVVVGSSGINPGDSFPLGATIVTYTATDEVGNFGLCAFNVIVEDNEAPVLTCQDYTATLDAGGNITITATDVFVSGTDNCTTTITPFTFTPSSFNCSNVGANIVTVSAFDDEGNSATCTSTVTVQDSELPVAVCDDITVVLDGTGNASFDAEDLNGGSTDNCGNSAVNLTLTADASSFGCAEVATTQVVTLTVTDASGNTATCASNVSVEDNSVPIAQCQNITVNLDATGNVTVPAANLDNGSTATCGIASFAANPATFDCTNVGNNPVVLTITANNGLTSSCFAFVDVVDDVPPVATCQDITVSLDAMGNVTVPAADVDGGSTDACGVDMFMLDNDTFSCADIGANAVTLTVTDVNGNNATCPATITVEDTAPPVAVCQDFTAQLDATGSVTIVAANVDGGSTDACGGVTFAIDNDTFDCTTVGANTVTLTVTDASTQTATCTATVTVEDNVAPMAVCTDITVQLDAIGNTTIAAADVDGGSTDACGVASLAVDNDAFTCADLGANTVILTVTDVNGNTAICPATVTIEDMIAPMAMCADLTVQLDIGGNASITAADVENGSTDACGVASTSLDITNFSCAELGANTVTLTATDDSGNTGTCTSTVTVEDNLPPSAICQNTTVQLDATGNASIGTADVDGGSTDNCSVASLSVSPDTFSCSEVGASNLATLTVTDGSGNLNQCLAVVNVEDVMSPMMVCADITVQLDATGNATITAADVDGGSTDNCAIALTDIDINSFDCTNIGANTVTLEATDVNGNTANCTSTVTVEDTVDPMAMCADITVQLDATGNASITAADVDGGSTDACGVASTMIDVMSFTCTEVGANTVTLTVTDVNANAATCTSTVTVEDTVDPMAMCADITVQLDATGNASITAADVDGGSTDACGVASTMIDVMSFTCTEVGANTVTLTVTDVNANAATCTSTVTVEDNIDPTAVCNDITVQLDATGNASITAADIDASSDACGGITSTIDISSFTCAEVGANVVTLTATDVNGNTSTCTSTVTVEDNIDPTAVCNDITVQLDATGNASITAADVDGGSTDNCGIASLAIDVMSFTCAEVGANTVTLTVTDVNANAATCTSAVTVEDNIDPTAVCNDITVQLDAAGTASITAADIDASSDACGGITSTIDISSFTCAEVGANVVTLTATDVNGNTSTCTSAVTVEDNIDPTAVCNDITVQLDATGNASITAADVDGGGSTDNCGVASIMIDIMSFTCAEVGANTVTLTVTDVNANVATCTSTVTVEDNVQPVALCNDFTVQLDAAGTASITTADIDGGSTDACSVAGTMLDVMDFTCAELGANTVTLTVTDVNGNTADCTSIVTVEDNVAPMAMCGDVTVQLDIGGNATITVADVENGSTDNCAVVSSSLDISTFGCTDLGTNTITLTVSDASGNTSTCTSTVTVEDNIPPVAVCQAITVQLDATGAVTITGIDIDGGSTDACSIATFDAFPNSFDCTNVGSNLSTLTVTDGSGNIDQCLAVVTVEDNIVPTAVCQDITVSLDATGTTTIIADEIDGGSTDNCSIAFNSVDISTFDCSNVGSNTVTLTVTDVNTNSSSCTATVTVDGAGTVPVANCIDATVSLDGNGTVTISPADVDGGSTSACGASNLTVSPDTFDCSNVGDNTVTLTITDSFGNSSSCTATVAVQDVTPPDAICQDVTVQLDASGSFDIEASDIDGGSSDNCDIALTSTSPTILTCSEVGVTVVTLFLVDTSGNLGTCNASVTVEDIIPPIAVCQDLTVELDEDGSIVVVPSDINNGSTDECGIASFSLDNDTFSCGDVGNNIITLTVVDANGNASNCSSNLIVEDNTDPVADCKDALLELDATGNVALVSADIDNGSFDACGGFTLSVMPMAYTCADVGLNIATLTIVDASGNSDNCTSVVIVEDNIAPTAVCQDITVELDAAGTASITAADVDGGSTDNCAIDENEVDITTFGCADVGTNTVTLTLTDDSENDSSCTATVTVEDNIAPTAVCQDITVELDATGAASITATDVDGGSIDNCATVASSIDISTFDCTNVGTPVGVTLTITGSSGNTSSCIANVTVEDNVAPDAVCQDVTVELDATGAASITAADVDGGSTDACGGLSFAVDITDFDCSNLGANTVTLTATDANGNENTCTANVIVEDNLVPTITCPADIVTCFETVFFVPPIVTDNCSTTVTLTNESNTSFPVGLTTVTATATDEAGNSASCSFDITVSLVDVTLVASDYSGFNVSSNGGSDGEITATAFDGIPPYNFDWSTGDTGATVTGLTAGFYNLTVTDATGCSAYTSIVLTEPTFSFNCEITATDLVCNGAADGEASIDVIGGVMPYSFLWNNGSTASSISGLSGGTYSVTVTDTNGNECIQSVTIEEPAAPPTFTGGESAVEDTSIPYFYDIVVLEIVGGVAPYIYEWDNTGFVVTSTSTDPDTGNTLITIVYDGAAIWAVTVTDSNGCGGSDVLEFSNNLGIGPDEPLNIIAYDITADNGTNSGSIDIDVLGGTPCTTGDAYTYTWSGPVGWTPPATNTDVVAGLASGWYTVTVTDCGSPAQSTVGWYWVPKQTRGRGKVALNNDMLQVAPNPFKDNTQVSFALPSSEHVELGVYDMTGRLITSLFSGSVEANEVQTFNFNAQNLPTGMYLCRLTTTEGASIHQKVILTAAGQ